MSDRLNLILRRRPSTENCTIGELYLDTGEFVCYTLEDVVREIEGQPVSAWKVKGKTAIPQGRYRVTISYSERFKKMMPLLNMVQGYSGVRIHPLNRPEETDGCIGPGMSVAADGESILESRFAYKKVYDLIDEALMAGDEVWIEVRNP